MILKRYFEGKSLNYFFVAFRINLLPFTNFHYYYLNFAL
jgi:hypothetical protein